MRHPAITGAEASGANVKAVQSFSRHSTIKLTINRYTLTNVHDLKGVVAGAKDPMAATQRGITVTHSDIEWTQKPAIQKTRWISIDTATPKVEASETTKKQAVSSRKQAEGEGFEPTDALRHLRFSRPVH